MTREWEPGDVAMVRYEGQEWAAALKTVTGSWWLLGKGTWTTRAEPVRPLVVIDPEDREQLSEFAAALMDAGSSCEHGLRCPEIACLRLTVADALRSLIEPPKPPEPTAMWSVVETADGDQWVRVLGPDFMDGWVRAGDLPSNGKWTDYRDIPAVRVLSEGVQP